MEQITIFTEIPQRCKLYKPDFTRATLGKFASVLIWFCIVSSSVGACSVYLAFNATLLNHVQPSLKHNDYVCFMGGVVVFLVFVQAYLRIYHGWAPMRSVAVTSTLGFFTAVLCAVSTAAWGFSERKYYGPYKMWDTVGVLRLFGVAAFLYAIVLFSIGPYNDCDRKQDFQSTLVASFSVVTVFNIAFGVAAFIAFGDHLAVIAVQNVTGPLGSALQTLLTLDLFFTYLIVMMPSSDLLRGLLGTYVSDSFNFSWENPPPPNPHSLALACLSPVLICGFTVVLAITVPSIDSLVNLVTSLGLSFSSFILPPLARLVLFYGSKTSFDFSPPRNPFYQAGDFCFHVLVVIFGLTALVYTFVKAVEGIIALYS